MLAKCGYTVLDNTELNELLKMATAKSKEISDAQTSQR